MLPGDEMKRLTWLIAFGLVFLLAGCNAGKKSRITVVRYPDFYQPELKRVAVIPFGDQTGNPEVGKYMARRLETALINNKTYEVYTREHLKTLLAEDDLAAAGIIDSEMAKRIGQRGSVQALICGVCSRHASGSRQVTMEKWVYAKSGSYKVQVPVTVYDALVECNVVVIDTATGRHLTGVNSNVPLSIRENVGLPRKLASLRGLPVIQVAEILCLGHILENIAVLRTEIKLKGTVLRIATGQYAPNGTGRTALPPTMRDSSPW